MAPEVLANETYDMKIDIWGVGAIAHVLLTGCLPFDGDDEEDLKMKIQWAQPSFGGKKIKSSLSKEAVDFLMLCLCRDQKRRPHAHDLL